MLFDINTYTHTTHTRTTLVRSIYVLIYIYIIWHTRTRLPIIRFMFDHFQVAILTGSILREYRDVDVLSQYGASVQEESGEGLVNAEPPRVGWLSGDSGH